MADANGQHSDEYSTRRRRRWWLADAVHFCLIILPHIALGHTGLLSYVAGRRNDPMLWFESFILWVLALVAALFSVALITTRMFVIWPKHLKDARKFYWQRPVIIVGLLFYLAGLPLGSCGPCAPPSCTASKGGWS